MFESFSEKFQNLFSGLLGKKKLTEENISDAVREVRLALLDADVNYTVASNFVKRVKEKALGDELLKSVKPDQQFIKIVHDELISLMGKEEIPLDLRGEPAVILMCGLQGSGKTTQSAKLATYLKKKEYNKKTMIAACDLQRPAAVEQLKRLGEQVGVTVFAIEGETNPLTVAKEALKASRIGNYDVLIVDTAGRLHLDDALMEQLEKMKELLSPQEVLFVASATTGQDAVKTAAEFDKRIAITGTILTMLDGNTRAGAAISIREITQKPLKFEGIGEKVTDFQAFNPRSMADRILGMGDIVNLVKRAEEHIDEAESKKMEEKLRKASFTYEDYLRQMSMIKKMGPLKSLLKMLPGLPALDNVDISQDQFNKIEAMILSMTPAERGEREQLTPPRRRRISRGSGTSIDDVNRMVKNFKDLKQFCKDMPSLKQKLKGLGVKENSLWH